MADQVQIEAPEVMARRLVMEMTGERGHPEAKERFILTWARIIRARDEQVLPALKEAIGQWADAAGYVSDYFREKWGHTEADIALAREAIVALGGVDPAAPEKLTAPIVPNPCCLSFVEGEGEVCKQCGWHRVSHKSKEALAPLVYRVECSLGDWYRTSGHGSARRWESAVALLDPVAARAIGKPDGTWTWNAGLPDSGTWAAGGVGRDEEEARGAADAWLAERCGR